MGRDLGGLILCGACTGGGGDPGRGEGEERRVQSVRVISEAGQTDLTWCSHGKPRLSSTHAEPGTVSLSALISGCTPHSQQRGVAWGEEGGCSSPGSWEGTRRRKRGETRELDYNARSMGLAQHKCQEATSGAGQSVLHRQG